MATLQQELSEAQDSLVAANDAREQVEKESEEREEYIKNLVAEVSGYKSRRVCQCIHLLS